VSQGLLGDRISSLKLSSPLIVEAGTPVGDVVGQVQKRGVGYVVVCTGKIPVGIMTERDVLLKVVARDVDYSEPVDNFMTRDPETLTNDRTIADGVALMDEKRFRHVPILDRATGEIVAVFSVRHVIDHVTESFPEQVMNLPPRPHQKMTTREGG